MPELKNASEAAAAPVPGLDGANGKKAVAEISLIDEIGRERAGDLIAGEVTAAIARADALGLPQVVNIDGVWSKRYPDGRVEPIE